MNKHEACAACELVSGITFRVGTRRARTVRFVNLLPNVLTERCLQESDCFDAIC